MNDRNTQSNNSNEPATDAVDRVAQAILDALEAKDPAKYNSYYAPDAVIATAGRPAAKDERAVSKAIRDDVLDPNFKLSLSNEKTEVAGSGDLAYRRGSFTVTFTNPQTKQAENSAGTYLTVFRKHANGSWKVVEDFGV
jgi:ketosteroid isomerase-like protein